jgi:transposase-like protein
MAVAVTAEGHRDIFGLRADTAGGEGAEIRKIVCPIAIKSVDARRRRAVRTCGHFLSETAALECVHLAVMGFGR